MLLCEVSVSGAPGHPNAVAGDEIGHRKGPVQVLNVGLDLYARRPRALWVVPGLPVNRSEPGNRGKQSGRRHPSTNLSSLLLRHQKSQSNKLPRRCYHNLVARLRSHKL
jgi:hypothetical protein